MLISPLSLTVQMSRVMIVGDLHGNWGPLNTLMNKKRPDIVLQCGDFGWWPQWTIKKSTLYSHHQEWSHKGLKVPEDCKLYWCDGNHEQYSDLQQYQDGTIHEMYDRVFYGSRGATLELPDGRIVLFAGGASSIDRDNRTPGYDWFPEENICRGDLDRMLSHDHVDILISHTCPVSFDVRGVASSDKAHDSSRYALEEVLQKYNPSQWFFGHYHKAQEGAVSGDKGSATKWQCLDYPKHGGKWWHLLMEL